MENSDDFWRQAACQFAADNLARREQALMRFQQQFSCVPCDIVDSSEITTLDGTSADTHVRLVIRFQSKRIFVEPGTASDGAAWKLWSPYSRMGTRTLSANANNGDLFHICSILMANPNATCVAPMVSSRTQAPARMLLHTDNIGPASKSLVGVRKPTGMGRKRWYHSVMAYLGWQQGGEAMPVTACLAPEPADRA